MGNHIVSTGARNSFRGVQRRRKPSGDCHRRGLPQVRGARRRGCLPVAARAANVACWQAYRETFAESTASHRPVPDWNGLRSARSHWTPVKDFIGQTYWNVCANATLVGTKRCARRDAATQNGYCVDPQHVEAQRIAKRELLPPPPYGGAALAVYQLSRNAI